MRVKYDPVLFDLAMNASPRDDVAWYRCRARQAGGPVLELGAGTGRITIPLAQDGVSVHAIDCDPKMLSCLHDKIGAQPPDVAARIHVMTGDMRSLQLDQQFALAIIPFHAFLENDTPADQLACLRAVHDHLEPGATLVFDVFCPSREYLAQYAGPQRGVVHWSAQYALPCGDTVVRWESIEYDTDRRVTHTHHRYESYSAGGALTATALHWLTMACLQPDDLHRLLAHAGFERVRIAGGAFGGRPIASDGDELVVEAVRV